MSGQGCTWHIRAKMSSTLRLVLASSAPGIAILDEGSRWTSLGFPGHPPELAKVAPVLPGALLELWFDEDDGLTLRWAEGASMLGELHLSLTDPGWSVEDDRFVSTLVSRGLVSASARAALARGATDPSWIRAHGIEKLLRLPYKGAAPVGLGEAAFRALYPGCEVLGSAQPPIAVARAPVRAPPVLSPAQAATCALHAYYLSNIWNTNDRTLVNAYRRQLPADRRSEVEAIWDAVMLGTTLEEMEARVAAVLYTAWAREDWDQMIRDPDLLERDGATDDQRQEWAQRLRR